MRLLLSCRHAWASVDVADGHAILLFLVDHTHKVPQVAVVLHNYELRLALAIHEGDCKKFHTLVGNPLALFDSLWSGTQGHEVALDNVLGIVGIEPQRQRAREVIGLENILAA